MDHEPQTPAFDAPAPHVTPGVAAMCERVAQRLFGIGTPQQLGRYTIDRRLGAGGMGVVYAAFDAELSRQVAIKLVRTAQASTREQDRLREEARALAQLSHPNVVQIYEVGVHGDQLYLVMEYVEGSTLEHWACDRSVREILRCCVEAGHGIAAAHEVGLLHRDVKPNNIVVGVDGRVRVIDFGLASATASLDTTPSEADRSGEQTSRLVGTPAYLAPELYARQPASPRSDQFSFCVTVWQVLCGVRPFTAEQLFARDRLRPTGKLRPRWLQAVLARGLAFEPEQRWPSMAALLDELESRPRRRLLSATFLGVALFTGLLASSSLLSPARCPDPSPIFAEVWNPERREALARQLTARPGGEAELALLTEAVEGHREAWLETHASACAATRIERSRTEVQLERALTCLERDRARLDAMLELIEGPLGLEIDLRRLLVELGEPSRCVDESTSVDQIAPPPQLADPVAELRAELDEIALLHGVEPRRASVEASRLVIEARELGFAPLLAEALALDGKAAIALRDDRRALASLREAARLGKALADPRLELACLHQLVHLTTTQLEDPERGADLVALMLGSFEQLGRPAELLADVLIAESELAHARGELDVAESHLRRAVEHLRQHADASDYQLERSEISLANVIAEQGRLSEAVRIYDALLARSRRVFGHEHPSVATIEFNLAVTLLDAGEVEGAREHGERALAIQRVAYGSDSVRIAPALIVVAQARAATGEIDAALAASREAWPLERQLAPENSERGNSLRFEVALFNGLGRYEEALAGTEQLLREVGPSVSPVERAMYEHSAGWLMCRVGRCAEAGPRFHRALASAHEQTRLYARLGLTEVALARGRVGEAQAELDELRPALEQLSPIEARAEALAELEFIALRCALARGDAPEQVRAQLEQVALGYSAVGIPIYLEDALTELRLELEKPP